MVGTDINGFKNCKHTATVKSKAVPLSFLKQDGFRMVAFVVPLYITIVFHLGEKRETLAYSGYIKYVNRKTSLLDIPLR